MEPGDLVRVRVSGGQIGVVIEVYRSTAHVLVGDEVMLVHKEWLRAIDETR